MTVGRQKTSRGKATISNDSMNLVNLLNISGFIIFFSCVSGLLLHTPFALYLKYYRRSKEKPVSVAAKTGQELFHVIQLPVYNEKIKMVSSLLRSACNLDYPKEKFCIQLLDDSTIPEISSNLKACVTQIKNEHPDLQLTYHHREHREEYKAGNLNFGLKHLNHTVSQSFTQDSNHVIISIFDADYLITNDYLKRINKHFSQPDTGIVQANTSFRNTNTNEITMAQTVFQNNLQLAELSARSRNDHLSMFRGSAGSLRLSTIEDCGYWHGDTQIEDVDLSFLAQTRGWKLVYDDSVVCSSLLPENYNEYKLQQRSWMKGLMEVMRKRIGQVLFSRKLTVSQKLGGLDFFFILSLQSLYMILAHLTLIPAYNYWCSFASSKPFNIFLASFVFLLVATHIPLFVRNQHSNILADIEVGARNTFRQALYSFSLMTAMFPTFSIGLIEGLMGGNVHRHRTGKGKQQQGDTDWVDLPQSSLAILRRINTFEVVMACYSIFLIGWSLHLHEYFISAVYGILAIIYPVNAAISYRTLRRK